MTALFGQGILPLMAGVTGRGILRDLSQSKRHKNMRQPLLMRGRDLVWLTGSLGEERDPFRLTGHKGTWQAFRFPETGTYICKFSPHAAVSVLEGKRRTLGVLIQTPLSPPFLSLRKVLPVVTRTCIVPPMRWQYIILPRLKCYNFTSALMRLNFTNRFIAKLDILRISITPSLSLLSAPLFQAPSVTFLAINFIFLLSFYTIIYIFCISFPIFTNAKLLYHSFNSNSLLPSRALISASLGLLGSA